jgi:serine phosphatase RsbU (regulator of sigma subunit)
MLGSLIDESHTLHPDAVAPTIARKARLIGARSTALYLVDKQQSTLVPAPGQDPALEALGVDTTIAGRVYRTTQSHELAADEAGAVRFWLPLIDGADRLGVMSTMVDQPDAVTRGRLRQLAGLAAELIVSKSKYGDSLELAHRSGDMELAAELRWAMLPPLSYTGPLVSLAAMLAPAYEVAGDTFDYALNGDTLHVALFDAMGHGLPASRIANLAVITYRWARRRGYDLPGTMAAIDSVSRELGDESFATGHLATLSLTNGMLRWVNAGHPPALLLRRGSSARELAAEASLPLGLGGSAPAHADAVRVNEASLEPDDIVLFYTDGITEARSPTGELFGADRLADFLVRAAASEEPPSEMVRRLVGSVLEHQAGKLDDDATVLLVRWPRQR